MVIIKYWFIYENKFIMILFARYTVAKRLYLKNFALHVNESITEVFVNFKFTVLLGFAVITKQLIANFY